MYDSLLAFAFSTIITSYCNGLTDNLFNVFWKLDFFYTTIPLGCNMMTIHPNAQSKDQLKRFML